MVEQTLVYNHLSSLFHLLWGGYVWGTRQRLNITYKNPGTSNRLDMLGGWLATNQCYLLSYVCILVVHLIFWVGLLYIHFEKQIPLTHEVGYTPN